MKADYVLAKHRLFRSNALLAANRQEAACHADGWRHGARLHRRRRHQEPWRQLVLGECRRLALPLSARCNGFQGVKISAVVVEDEWRAAEGRGHCGRGIPERREVFKL